MRKIPATMVTQHPDHANTPYWHDKPFITTKHEPQELFLSFSELGATEYKWDWEGKLVDESVIERIFSNYYDFFSKKQIGRDFFLTFRLPNPKVETEFRLGRAYMSILAAAGLARYLNLNHKPLFEVILPMTTSAEEMIAVQEAFRELTSLKHPLLKLDSELKHIELIPLFEDIETIANSHNILKKYLAYHKEKFGFEPEYMRPYVARSDPALNAGIVPTVLAIKIALSHYADLEKEVGIPMYPVIGAAALPFRGGLRPDHVETFINEYQGIRTTTIQSAFRYDFAKHDVLDGIRKLEKILPTLPARHVPLEDEKELLSLMPLFEKEYKKTIEQIAPLINDVAKEIPRRRERVQHVGLFGYSRGVGTVQLPRAIGFTAALYSLGIPPELIGTGRGIAALKKLGKLDLLEKYYLNMKADLSHALVYTNIPLLEKLSKENAGLKDILTDVHEITAYLGGVTEETKHKEHKNLNQRLINRMKTGKSFKNIIEESGKIRQSIG